MNYFYILRCGDDSLYCGHTNDLKRRIKEHNSDSNKSAKYTRSRQPTYLVYKEDFPSLQLAMKREFQVKRWSKSKKEALISGNIDLLKSLSKKNLVKKL